jgi:hypothetical protein
MSDCDHHKRKQRGSGRLTDDGTLVDLKFVLPFLKSFGMKKCNTEYTSLNLHLNLAALEVA